MNILYLHSNSLDTTKANMHQTVAMCNAFSECGNNVILMVPTLGDANAERLKLFKNNYIKVPQINWHEIAPGVSNISWKNSLLKEHKSRDSLYFVHSFVAKPSNIDHVLANYNCNGILIPALIIKDNVVGCQFHPEKSGDVGLKILKNFMLM